jgi:hypothetical protein
VRLATFVLRYASSDLDQGIISGVVTEAVVD